MVESVSTQFVLNYFKELLSLISSRRGLTFNIAVRLVLLLKRIDKRSQVARAIITYKGRLPAQSAMRGARRRARRTLARRR